MVPLTEASKGTVKVLEAVPPEIVKPVAAAVGVNPLIDVAVATPKMGVTSVGDVFITKVEPVPVCDATAVAFPDEVIGPVRFALVTTVVAFPTLVTIPVRLALVVLFPFSFWMAVSILSEAVIVPAPLV